MFERANSIFPIRSSDQPIFGTSECVAVLPNPSMHRTLPPRPASILRRFGYPGSTQLHAGGSAGDLQKLGGPPSMM